MELCDPVVETKAIQKFHEKYCQIAAIILVSRL